MTTTNSLTPLQALCTAAESLDQNIQTQQAEAIQELFGPMTPWYDRQNRLFTLGLDQLWRRKLINGISLGSTQRLLDLAAGTLDISLMLTKKFPTAQILALDLCLPMLHYGLTHKTSKNMAIAPAQADARALPLANTSIDAVTIAFGLRNMEPRAKVFQEILRVLIPGGQLHILELAPMRTPIIGSLYHWHLKNIMPYLAGLISHKTEAFKYLFESITRFPAPPALACELETAGFQTVTWEALCLGIVNIHRATKPQLEV